MKKLILLGTTAASLLACSTPEKGMNNVSANKVGEEVSIPREVGNSLRAGRMQELQFSFSEPMGMVLGILAGTTVYFDSIDASSQTWRAAFLVPEYDRLGSGKFMRIVANDLAGEAIVNSSKQIPEEWNRRGPDGKFPQIPDEYRHLDIPIRDE